MDIGENDIDMVTSPTEEKQSFFQRLFGNLFGSSNPEAERKRRLKAIAKTFSKTKYHNFYKPSTYEVLPSFAKLFYEIYKVISPCQLFLKSNPNSQIYKRQIINYSLSEKQLNLISHFDEQKILEISKKYPLEQISNQIEKDLEVFSLEFDGERVGKTENLYKAFCLFKDFCSFDFYILLKKFASSIQENVFSFTPNFEKINAEYILDDLKDFCIVAYSITDESILWNNLFDYFKASQSTEFISLNNWKKIISKIKSIQTSKSFDLMIQHIGSNPKYATSYSHSFESIVEPYLEKIQNDTHEILSKISNMQKESKTNQVLSQIFGKTSFENIHNYVSSANEPLSAKNLSIYEYTEALNYLKTFLLDYVKKDIREYYDVIVIRGQWDSTLSAPMSNAYQELLKTSELITAFDNELAEDGNIGSKIKNLLPKTTHDHGAESIINRVVTDANETVRGYIISSTQNLITIGKTIKQLLEDYGKPKAIIIQNWHDLERYLDHPIKDFSVNIYKKIYLFVQLMQQYL